MKIKSQVRMVNQNGTITPEGLAVLQPSRDNYQTFVALEFTADTQVQVFLPSSLSVTLTRNGNSIIVTTNTLILNPGDKMSLASSQTIKLAPL